MIEQVSCDWLNLAPCQPYAERGTVTERRRRLSSLGGPQWIRCVTAIEPDLTGNPCCPPPRSGPTGRQCRREPRSSGGLVPLPDGNGDAR